MLKNIKELDRQELITYLSELTEEQLKAMDLEDLEYAFYELTPYTYRGGNKSKLATILKTWLDDESTWEVFPYTRKEMYSIYRKVTGVEPLSIPTLSLFSALIGWGLIA